MIIGITGTNGAGKGAVVRYLKSKGFVHHSMRSHLEGLLSADGIFVDRSALRARANELRKAHGAEYLAREVCSVIEQNGENRAVVESIRTTAEADYIKKQGGVLIAIDAERNIRYERIVRRASKTDKVDFQTFVQEEEREWHGSAGPHDMNVRAVMAMAEFTLQNNATLSDLHKQIEEVLTKIEKVV